MRVYLAEFIGTAVLILVGVGSAVLSGDHITWLGIGLSFGLSLGVMVYVIGPISGCHINPAVTLGMCVAGRSPWREFVPRVIAQLLGGIAGAAIIWAVSTSSVGADAVRSTGFACNGFGDHSPGNYPLGAAFLMETVATFLLVFTVLSTTDRKAAPGFAGIAIGLALFLAHMIAIPVTNASVNPARSLGPAVFEGGWALGQIWLFFTAPFLGGIIAAAIYKLVVESPVAATTGTK
jgi:aquaporin Z